MSLMVGGAHETRKIGMARKKSDAEAPPSSVQEGRHQSGSATEQGGIVSGETPQYAAPALDKGIDILELLTDAEHGLTMAEIAQGLGRSMSEIFRMVVTLQRRGWVSLDRGDRYHLSSKMFQLAHRHRPVRTLIEAALPMMQWVARQALQSCHITIVESGRVMVIAQVEAPGHLTFGVRTGSIVGLFNTASGQVHLAFLPAEERRRLIEDYTLMAGESEVSRTAWETAVDKVTVDGYACSLSQQVRGVTNIGYPLWGGNGHVVAALVMPYMEGIGAQRGPTLEEARDILAEGSAEISRSLGYQPKSLPQTSL